MESEQPRVRPLLVVVIGGNAPLGPGEPASIETQRSNVAESARHLAALATDHDLVITHGNGPQVGQLAIQPAADPALGTYPLDVLDAESVGMIGYLIVQALSRHIDDSRVAAVLTRVEVNPSDPAFVSPTKPIGAWSPRARGEELATRHGWSVVRRDGELRRVVASPEPLRILETSSIRTLVEHHHIVVAAGGGGIPVARADNGPRRVEAVVDKDLTSSLLALELEADRLVILTDVDGVYENFGGPNQTLLDRVPAAKLRGSDFEPDTMAPKAEAVCRFVEGSGNDAVIGALRHAAAVAAGDAGTTIVADTDPGKHHR
ncbi:MAG: carbamate kinase [Actinomycetota bacterium]|nr:carbamate kinase [Actinomycetota bacterium]